MHGALAPEEVTQVEEHLDGCSDCQRMVMEALRASTAEHSVPDGEELRHQLDSQINIGRFTVLQYLGSGAMGVVYAAYDPKLDRKVALKLVRSRVDEADAEALERLTGEARAMARLSHANVVAVHEVGEFHGQVFIAMEYVTGENLRAWLNRGNRTTDEVVRTFHQAARGLAAAHRAGVVHRDFKPENVLVDEDGAVRVSDFGLARSDGLEKVSATAFDSHSPIGMSRSRGLVGTPAYMAPEQLKGGKADARSDQFAFCLALYEALSGGQRPFEGQTPAALLKEMEVGPPSLGPLLRRVVPLRLQRLVLRGLSLDPRERYPSMDALVADLGRDPWFLRRLFLGGMVALAAATVLMWGSLRLANSSPVLCRGGEAMMKPVWSVERRAALAAGLEKAADALSVQARTRLLTRLDDWAQQWQTEYTEACQATMAPSDQPRSALTARLLCLQSRLDDGDVLVQVLLESDAKALGRGLDLVEAMKPLAACRDVTARPMMAGLGHKDSAAFSSLQRRVAQLQTRHEMGVQSLEAEADALITDLEQVGAKTLLAEVLLVRGVMRSVAANQSEAARETFQRARLVALSAGHDFVAVQALSREIIVVAYALGQPEEARALEPTLMALLERAGHPPELEAEALVRLSAAMALRGETQESRRLAERSIALLEKARPQSLTLARAYADAAISSQSEGDWLDVLDKMSKAVAIRTSVVGPDSRLMTLSYLNIASAYNALNRPREAEAHFQKFQAMLDRYFPAEHKYRALVPQMKAEMARNAGDFEQSLKLLEEASTMLDALGLKQSGQRSQLDVDLGRAYLEMGQLPRCLTFIDRALATERADNDSHSPEHGAALMVKGLWALERKDFAAAAASLESSLVVFERLSHPDRVLARSALAEVEAARGRKTEAQAHAAVVLGLPLDTLLPLPGDRALIRYRLAKVLAREEPAQAKRLVEQAREGYDAKARPAGETAKFNAFVKSLR